MQGRCQSCRPCASTRTAPRAHVTNSWELARSGRPYLFTTRSGAHRLCLAKECAAQTSWRAESHTLAVRRTPANLQKTPVMAEIGRQSRSASFLHSRCTRAFSNSKKSFTRRFEMRIALVTALTLLVALAGRG